MDKFDILRASGAVLCIDEPSETGGGDAAKPAEKPADDGSGDELGENGKKALVAERDARKQAEKDRDAALARVKELEESAKPDAKSDDALEALKAQVAKLTEERDELAAEKAAAAVRAEVLDAKDIPERLRKWVTGSTKEELEKSADEVLADFREENPVNIPGPRKRETAPRKGVDAGGDLYDELHGKTGN